MMHRNRRITKAYFYFARRQYAPLINRLAFKVGHNTTQVDELKAIADDELLKCMICYQNCGSFMTFLFSRLFGSMRHMRDAEYRAKRLGGVSLDAMAHIAEPYRDISSGMAVQECLDCLNKAERSIIVDLFFEEKTMREMSRDHGMPITTICHTKYRAINKMRQKCGVD